MDVAGCFPKDSLFLAFLGNFTIPLRPGAFCVLMGRKS